MANSITSLSSEFTNARVPSVTDARGRQELGQEDFLQLMVTQLRNQDPFKPLEPDQFLGQLAQFSTVSGIESMRDSLTGLSTSLQGSQVLQGATLVGRSILAAGQVAELSSTGLIAGSLGAPAGADTVQVRVINENGTLVRSFNVTPGADFTDFVWDGRNDRGERMPPGYYGIEGVAQVGGRRESVEMLLRQRVDSVTIEPIGGALRLNTASGAIALGDVRRIM
jgi:flagellar basal-body rod modification protein FlgD